LTDNKQLLAWAASIIAAAQAGEAYGKITVHVEKGVITRVETQESLRPPRAGDIAR
jgi:hypothetical protein